MITLPALSNYEYFEKDTIPLTQRPILNQIGQSYKLMLDKIFFPIIYS